MGIEEIRVSTPGEDPRGREIREEAARTLGVALDAVHTTTVYRVEGITPDEAEVLAREALADPVTERAGGRRGTVITEIDGAELLRTADRTVEVAYQPGVMNPESESIERMARSLGINPTAADSSLEVNVLGEISDADFAVLTDDLANQTVQRLIETPPRTLRIDSEPGPTTTVPIREASDAQLIELSEGALFLNLEEMQVIRSYFQQLDREPTDCELELIAGRWSEHCDHKTFKAKIFVDGEEKAPFIRRISEAAREFFGDKVVSAFGDNSGVIRFFDGYVLNGKVETHNSPSALEPYGGAATGTGGVLRDIAGTGQGFENILSTNMFFVAPPDTAPEQLPPGTKRPDHLLRRLVAGVRDYGNRMGVPTADGSVHFHTDARAKPSVIVGAFGIAPEQFALQGTPQVGDRVVAVGGRTGRDGIHGATFSSGEMTDQTASANSTAVQIGNAIEEKRTFDALIEARDRGLVRAMTDCGAAGFSSAIGEIGEHTGVRVDISKAPLKYEGLAPWEIWMSESQERMVLAVAPEHWEEFQAICDRHHAEATNLGEFDGSNELTVMYGDECVANLDYDFLINGLPQREMEAIHPVIPEHGKEHLHPQPTDWETTVLRVLAHGNVCSKEPIVRQYDHTVQGTNIVPPYDGVDQDGPNDAVVLRPLLDKPYGAVFGHGLNPVLTEADPYWGTHWANAEALANYVSAGGDPERAGLVGNYIGPVPEPAELGKLDRSVDAAEDFMRATRIPVVSGKDSLSSTYRNKQTGETIRTPLVHCVSAFGAMENVAHSMTTELKQPGSILCLVGNPDRGALGGSAYFDATDGQDGRVPRVDLRNFRNVLDTVHAAVKSGDVRACHDVSEGGVVSAVAEMCFGGNLGARLHSTEHERADFLWFNETAGTFVVEVADHATAERLFGDKVLYRTIGQTTTDPSLAINHGDTTLMDTPLAKLKTAWQRPMKELFHG